MRIYETPKFTRLRKKIKEENEKSALKEAILKIMEIPLIWKKLKGEFKDLRSYKYFVKGQQRRLIYQYKEEENSIYLLSFGPREGIYK